MYTVVQSGFYNSRETTLTFRKTCKFDEMSTNSFVLDAENRGENKAVAVVDTIMLYAAHTHTHTWY